MAEKKIAVITGGSSGIGMALAAKLSADYKVYILDINPPTVQLDATYIQTDVTKSSDVLNAVEQIESVDLLINNAGVMRRGTILDSAESDFDILFDVNVKGSWLILKHFVQKLTEGATVVQMSSEHALSMAENPGLYTLTKVANSTLTKLFEKTCPQYKVKYLYPGPTDTPMARYGLTEEAIKQKEKIMFSVENVAQKIVDLIGSDKNSLIFDQSTWDYKSE